MLILNDPSSPPTFEFVVEFVAFGTRTRCAIRQRAIIFADKARDARRILKTKYRRTGDVKIVSKRVVDPPQLPLANKQQ
jgi:hypothetical protein